VSEWSLVTLAAAGAVGAVIAFDWALLRRRRRRNAIGTQLRERRIEVVPFDDSDKRSTQFPSPRRHERRGT
jgi:hypothetical protein